MPQDSSIDESHTGRNVATVWMGVETMRVNMHALSINSTNRLAITLLGRADGDHVGDNLNANAVWDRLEATALTGLDETAGSRHRLDVQKVAGASHAELLNSLDAAMALERKKRRGVTAQLAVRMAASLRLQPERAEDMAQRIRADEPSELSRILVGVLGDAGTPQAQSALAGLITAPDVHIEHRVDGVVALGTTEHPSAEAQKALLGLVGESEGDVELRTTANLALGNMVQQMAREQGGGSESGDALVDELIDQLQAASTVEDKTTCLMALGNAGSNRAFAALDPYVTAPGPLQEAAVFALRFLTLPEVDERISLALTRGIDSV